MDINGVSHYKKARYITEINYPANIEMACKYCPYCKGKYTSVDRVICVKTYEDITQTYEQRIGVDCPLEFEKEK